MNIKLIRHIRFISGFLGNKFVTDTGIYKSYEKKTLTSNSYLSLFLGLYFLTCLQIFISMDFSKLHLTMFHLYLSLVQRTIRYQI